MANAMAASVAVGGRGLVSRGAVRGETRPSRTQSSCAVASASLSGANAGTAVACSLRLGGASSSTCDGATPWLQSRPIRARSSSPILAVVAAVWEGPGVVASARKLIGATNPLYAEPGTIRGDFGVNTGRNVIHGSDSPKNGEREIGHCRSNGGRWSKTFRVGASNSSFGAESLRGDDPGSPLTDGRAEDAIEPTSGPSRFKGSLQVVGVLGAILGIGSLAALTLTLNNGGPAALLDIVSKTGFPAAFALIFVSEIGDKTFFIAALLAMRYSKWLVLLGASGALAVMTVISVIIGKLFRRVPAQLQTTLPVGEYAAVALLIWFGLRSIKTAWDIPSTPAGDQSELGELAEAEAFLKQAHDKKVITPLEVLGEAFTLTFVAEWGDRSMLATIALGASQSPWGVASGAIAGHVLATLLAVTGGALLAGYLSEKLIGYFGGFLFLVFAAATLAGVF